MHSAVGWIVDLMIAPVQSLPGWIGLTLVSAICGVVLLFLWGKVSSQSGIKQVKRDIAASMYEAVLFRRDILVSLKAQGRLFGYAAKYFGYAVPPLIILAIPCVLMLSQLNLHYGVRPLKTGESAVLTVDVEKLLDPKGVKAEPGAGLELSPPVRSPNLNEVSWRVRVLDETKPVTLRILAASANPIDLDLAVHNAAQKVYAHYSKSWLESLMYPAAQGLRADPNLKGISIDYPASDLRLPGVHLHWLVVFFLVSLASGLIASRWLKVQI